MNGQRRRVRRFRRRLGSLMARVALGLLVALHGVPVSTLAAASPRCSHCADGVYCERSGHCAHHGAAAREDLAASVAGEHAHHADHGGADTTHGAAEEPHSRRGRCELHARGCRDAGGITATAGADPLLRRSAPAAFAAQREMNLNLGAHRPVNEPYLPPPDPPPVSAALS